MSSVLKHLINMIVNALMKYLEETSSSLYFCKNIKVKLLHNQFLSKKSSSDYFFLSSFLIPCFRFGCKGQKEDVESREGFRF